MASTNRDEISRLELLHAAHPDGLVFPHLADAYRRAGRFAQAESVLNAGLRRHADYSSAHVVLGRLRLDQGKRRQAESAFQRVLQLDPENQVALEVLGQLAAEEGRPEDALPYLRRLASVKPDKELEQQVRELERRAAEARAARSSPAQEGRSEVPGNGDGGVAADPEDTPLPTLPEPGEVVTETMAELYMRQGLYERAAAVYRQLLDRNPGNARLHAKLQQARANRGDGPEAAGRAVTPPPETARAPTEPTEGPVLDLEEPRAPEPVRGAPGPVAEAPPEERRSSAAPPPAGPPIREYLGKVLSWRERRPRAAAEAPAEEVPPAETRAEKVPSPGTAATAGPPADRESAAGGAGASTGAGRFRPVEAPASRPRWRAPLSPTLDTAEPDLEGVDAHTRALVALTDILVGLLEYRDPFFRGSSSLTRLLASTVAEELALDASQKIDLALAAVLRDLGRLALGGRLVESPKFSDTVEGRRKIERHVDLALQLMEGIRLPERVMLAVRHHHERWDGAGYPDGLSGEDIPYLARILSVVDSFAAMVSPRPYRLPRKVPAAVRELQEAAGTQYDPAAVDALLRVVARREQPHLGFVQRHHILLVDPDHPGAVVTAAKLCSAGYLAEVAVDPEAARERLRRVPVSALVVSAAAGDETAETLIRDLRLDPLFSSLPVVVVQAATVDLRVRLLESGADVCFPPGISYGELQGTLGALVRRTVRTRHSDREDPEDAPWLALQGDIQDFPVAWLLQVMKYDSRTAAIGIRTATEHGAIYIEQGDAVHAQIRGGAVGEQALKDMLQWRKGRFTVQPEARSKERSIEASIMHLLLTQAVEEDHAAAGVFGAVSDQG